MTQLGQLDLYTKGLRSMRPVRAARPVHKGSEVNDTLRAARPVHKGSEVNDTVRAARPVHKRV